MKVKPEHKSSTPKPAKSALNSTIEEKNKHEKVKNGKPLKVDKKMDKKSADVKKHDSMKKEKKAEGAKPVKKPVYSDDDNEPLVRFEILRYYPKKNNHNMYNLF